MSLSNKYRKLPEGHTAIDTLKVESGYMLTHELSPTTVSFFDSENLSFAYNELEERFRKILHLNPWLAGRLMRIKNRKHLQLVYPNAITDIDVHQLLNRQDHLTIDTNMHYNDLTDQIKKHKSAIIPIAATLINKDKPLMSITLSPVNTKCFSLVFSMSHEIADGATYYNILNMLCSKKDIIPLNAVRSKSYSCENAIGKKDYSYFTASCKSYVMNIVRSLIFGPKSKISAFYINDNAVTAIKSASKGVGKVPFISTNDIITSGFMNAINARLCFMAINFRNKIADVKMNDAGNYEGAKFYDVGAYGSPEGIRQSLQTTLPYKTRTKAMPSTWECIKMRQGGITNWSTFTGEFDMTYSQQTLHLPVIPIKNAPIDIAIIFRPQPGRVGIMIMSKYLDIRDCRNNSNNPLFKLLGASVSEKIFDRDIQPPISADDLVTESK